MNKFAFKELKVWQKAVDFADKVISLADELETERKHYRLIDQLEASSTSVAMNIAEGKGRYSKKEFVQFLYYARGSMYETITLLNIFAKRNWISQDQLEALEEDGMEVTNMIKGLINSISQR